ncbi:MAG TPA: hypothetical protein H9867_03675 [Candidatus Corynebacterium gallistercoris]|uniref:AMIN-like domain-containing protein n=1 Tax=Candidatus Corynebacterium gallistercoris TaxID=2838530 RepID=A0A9D1RW65_9CORY|nr:hypothetical protein [Candidatus Corynebacterium gallistercoris]
MKQTLAKKRRRVTVAAALTAAGVALAGCSTDGNDTPDSTSSHAQAQSLSTDSTVKTTTSEAAVQSKVTTSNELQPMAGSQPLDVLPGTGSHFRVQEMRSGAHRDFDRVVIELVGEGQPGWLVRLTEEPVQSGSGFPIEYEGEQAMVVAVRGVEAPITPEGEVLPPVDHPAKDPDMKVVLSTTDEGWFEGEQRFILGLNKRNPEFKVNLLTGPTRLVVDIMH